MSIEALYILSIILIPLAIIGIFTSCLLIFYRVKKPDEKSFLELVQILSLIINSEIDKYEKDIFKDSGLMSNAVFENRYREITTIILDSISPSFMNQLTEYITEATVVRYVARSVKEYLSKKVIGTV